jgi:hypothetical protein
LLVDIYFVACFFDKVIVFTIAGESTAECKTMHANQKLPKIIQDKPVIKIPYFVVQVAGLIRKQTPTRHTSNPAPGPGLYFLFRNCMVSREAFWVLGGGLLVKCNLKSTSVMKNMDFHVSPLVLLVVGFTYGHADLATSTWP